MQIKAAESLVKIEAIPAGLSTDHQTLRGRQGGLSPGFLCSQIQSLPLNNAAAGHPKCTRGR